jgi:hypothetical protein
MWHSLQAESETSLFDDVFHLISPDKGRKYKAYDKERNAFMTNSMEQRP